MIAPFLLLFYTFILIDVHQDAKKAVLQAEGRYNTKDSHFDGACQEVLNHLTTQVYTKCMIIYANWSGVLERRQFYYWVIQQRTKVVRAFLFVGGGS